MSGRWRVMVARSGLSCYWHLAVLAHDKHGAEAEAEAEVEAEAEAEAESEMETELNF
jgi:hypothetical protein